MTAWLFDWKESVLGVANRQSHMGWNIRLGEFWMHRMSRLSGARLLAVAVCWAALCGMLAGCGGGTLSSSGPVVSMPVITTVPQPLTAAGGTAAVQVNISGSLIDFTNNPPRGDVKDVAGVSLLGGPQLLNNSTSDPSLWTLHFNVPANAGVLLRSTR